MLNHQFRDPSWPEPEPELPAEADDIARELRYPARYIEEHLRAADAAIRNVLTMVADEGVRDNFDRLCKLTGTVTPPVWGDLGHPDDIRATLEDLQNGLHDCGVK